MPIQCNRNFLANGISGVPGKTLNAEEIETLAPVMAQLMQEGLVSGHVVASDMAGVEVEGELANNGESETEAKPEAMTSERPAKHGKKHKHG